MSKAGDQNPSPFLFRPVLWVPLVVFLGFALAASYALVRSGADGGAEQRIIRSRLIGQPLPDFNLPPALPGRGTIRRADFGTGSPRILNVFASWCVPCIGEAPQLMALQARGLPIDAIAIRDRAEDVQRFLGQWGDPYDRIGLDAESSLQLAMGSSGVPETFIVDGQGVIRYQHIGAINAADMPRIIAEYEAARAPL